MIQFSALRVAVWLPLVMVLGYAAVLVSNLGNGIPSHWDEYLTLVRSQSFEQTGDWWAVHLNEAPDFKKPPLQYWMTAVLMKSGVDGVLAGRAISVGFTIGLLGAVVLLVFAMYPAECDRRWILLAIVMALAILFTSSFVLWAGRSCLLDSGMAFFVTLTLAALLMTKRNGVWWMVAAVAAGLGSMQKSHFSAVIFVVFGVVLLVMHWRKNQTSLHRHAWMITGMSLAVMLVLATFWPVLQTIRFGRAYLNDAFGIEVASRFKPSECSSPIYRLNELTGWMVQDSSVLLCFGLGAFLLLPMARGVRGNYRVWCMFAFVISCILGLMMASGYTYDRYVLAFSPVLVGVAAVVWTDLFQKHRVMIAIPILLLAGSVFQWPTLARVYAAEDPQFETIRTTAVEFGRDLKKSDVPVVVKIYDLTPFAFFYWSGLDRRALLLIEERLKDKDPQKLAKIDLEKLTSIDPGLALHGVSYVSQLPLVRHVFATRDVKEEKRIGPYVIWNAKPHEKFNPAIISDPVPPILDGSASLTHGVSGTEQE